jgi:hypothetical protein
LLIFILVLDFWTFQPPIPPIFAEPFISSFSILPSLVHAGTVTLNRSFGAVSGFNGAVKSRRGAVK